MVSGSDRWRAVYPGASVGVLAMSQVSNPENSPSLDAHKGPLESELRSRYGRSDRSQIRSHVLVAPYTSYYKRFDKTYHVQHQLESVVFKGKPIPGAAALVEAMFMAELRSMILTAGHDLASVRGALAVDVADGTETYITLNGRQQTLKQGDMFIRDEEGILSSIIYGPDHRSRIIPGTSRVVFTAYAPLGVPLDKVRAHLADLRDYVLLVSPSAQVLSMGVLQGGPDPAHPAHDPFAAP